MTYSQMDYFDLLKVVREILGNEFADFLERAIDERVSDATYEYSMGDNL